jgi:glutamyl-tRNA synthetase
VKWNDDKRHFFQSFSTSLASIGSWNSVTLEASFKQMAEQAGIKAGELQLPLRIMLVGDKFGPGVFLISEVLGKEETITRIQAALKTFTF